VNISGVAVWKANSSCVQPVAGGQPGGFDLAVPLAQFGPRANDVPKTNIDLLDDMTLGVEQFSFALINTFGLHVVSPHEDESRLPHSSFKSKPDAT
jgi:hypothetical protein